MNRIVNPLENSSNNQDDIYVIQQQPSNLSLTNHLDDIFTNPTNKCLNPTKKTPLPPLPPLPTPNAQAECRICLDPSQPLISACKCCGSSKYLHESCLLTWLEKSNTKPHACEICKYQYGFYQQLMCCPKGNLREQIKRNTALFALQVLLLGILVIGAIMLFVTYAVDFHGEGALPTIILVAAGTCIGLFGIGITYMLVVYGVAMRKKVMVTYQR